MTTRSEKLSRLAVGSPCEASWEAMPGDERRRHCAQCDRPVHDFERLTPSEIAALVEASRGHLCARLTRDRDGRLVVAEHPLPAPLPLQAPRRAWPVAAAIVGGLLGLGAAEAAGPSPAPAAASPSPETPAKPERTPVRHSAAGGTLRGRIADGKGAPLSGVRVVARNTFDGRERSTATTADGEFALDGLAAGMYEVRGQRAGFVVAPQADLLLHPGEQRQVDLAAQAEQRDLFVTSGVIIKAPEPLRRVFEESELVVLATAGPSVGVGRGQSYGEVETEFTVDADFKGNARGRSLRIYHAGSASSAEEAERFAPGTRVLAFLDARDEDGGRVVYRSADYHHGLRVMPAAELAAYGERLTALARLLRPGRPQPADLAEWLVATAEEPLTRSEALDELLGAQGALGALATSRGTSPEQTAEDLREVASRFREGGGAFEQDPSPALLAAFLTAGQKERLSQAFQATSHLTGADLRFFSLVHSWAGDAARVWLAGKLTAPGTILDRQGLSFLARELADEELQGMAAAAGEEIEVYSASLSGMPPEEAERLRQQKEGTTARDLQRRFAAALGRRR